MTDRFTKSVLVDRLKFPYDRIKYSLDTFHTPYPKIWALRKIFSYAQHKQAFLNIDNDVYIGKRLFENIDTPVLFAQNFEHKFEIYKRVIQSYLSFNPKPDDLTTYLKSSEWGGSNLGVAGGKCSEFYKELYELVSAVLFKNERFYKYNTASDLSIFCEQLLFTYLAKKMRYGVHYLYDQVEERDTSFFQDIFSFQHSVDYVHIMGAKNCPELGERLSFLLHCENRELFDRCHSFVQRKYSFGIDRYVYAHRYEQARRISKSISKSFGNKRASNCPVSFRKEIKMFARWINETNPPVGFDELFESQWKRNSFRYAHLASDQDLRSGNISILDQDLLFTHKYDLLSMDKMPKSWIAHNLDLYFRPGIYAKVVMHYSRCIDLYKTSLLEYRILKLINNNDRVPYIKLEELIRDNKGTLLKTIRQLIGLGLIRLYP